MISKYFKIKYIFLLALVISSSLLISNYMSFSDIKGNIKQIEILSSCSDVDIEDNIYYCDNYQNRALNIGKYTIVNNFASLDNLKKDAKIPGSQYDSSYLANIFINVDPKNLKVVDSFKLDNVKVDFSSKAIFNDGELKTISNKYFFILDLDKITYIEGKVTDTQINIPYYQKIEIQNDLVDDIEIIIEDKVTSGFFINQKLYTYKNTLNLGKNTLYVKIPTETLGTNSIDRNYIFKVLDKEFIAKSISFKYNTLNENVNIITENPKDIDFTESFSISNLLILTTIILLTITIYLWRRK